MPYNKTVWVDGITALGPTNLNKIEQGIFSAHEAIKELDYGVYNLTLQNYYDGKISPKAGLMFDGFSDTAKDDGARTTAYINTSGRKLEFVGAAGALVDSLSTASSAYQIGYSTTSYSAGQKFQFATAKVITGFTVMMNRQNTNVTDAVYATLHLTSLTNPAVATSQQIAATSIVTGSSVPWQNHTFTFPTPYIVPANTVFYIRIQRTGAVNSTNYYLVAMNQSDIITGNGYQTNSSGGVTEWATQDLSVQLLGTEGQYALAADYYTDKNIFPATVTNARIWITRTANITVTPTISIVTSGGAESLQSPTFVRTDNLGGGLYEDIYSYEKPTGGVDVVLRLAISRASVLDAVYVQRYGVAVGV